MNFIDFVKVLCHFMVLFFKEHLIMKYPQAKIFRILNLKLIDQFKICLNFITIS